MTAPVRRSRHAYWLDAAFKQDLSELIADARRMLRRVDFDTVVCTGLSGTLIAPALWRALDVPYLAVVRKAEHPRSHSDRAVEGAIGERWLFVDDFIASGDTLRRVRDEVDGWLNAFGHSSIFVGTYEYYDDTLRGSDYGVSDL